MADADVDGSHIRTLLITLFAKYMRPVIEAGRLYAAMPPLHKVQTKGRNAETIYTYTQAEMERRWPGWRRPGKQVVTPIPRFKGLGEMDADELWDTTMNPATRSVRRITLDDVDAAERVLDLLMGEKVEPRRNWLIDSAKPGRPGRDRRMRGGEHTWHAKNTGPKVDLSAFDRAGAQRPRQPAGHRGRGLVPGVRVLGHPLPGAARRPRRPEAGAPAHPVLDVRAGLPARPRVREVGPRRR